MCYSPLDPREDTESLYSIRPFPPLDIVTARSIRERILKGLNKSARESSGLRYSPLDPREDTERGVVPDTL